MIYRLLALLTIVAVIAALLFLSGQQSLTPTTTAVQESGWEEGYSAQRAKLIETGADGLPLYTLDAATVRQLPNEGQVQLTQVRMSFRDAAGDPWIATADHGELQQPAEQVQLSGNVHVSGTFSGAAGDAQIFAPALSVDVRTHVVSTKDPVRMLWSGRQLSSTGLIANLNEHRVELESAVHGSFPQ
ncbi:MAG TPA: LPS export ABC transporter periplasmic protein LptC [Steroidobacteraceae bacterium]|nr:LPS export ABC transporter periplasmic protein LptC [Steroidobacteraceae bacterium]